MPNLFWHALERIPGMSAATAEWREALGPDWEWGRSILRPTQQQAETILLPGGLHRVVAHAHDRMVAVPVDGGRAQPIAPADLAVLELNPSRLAEVVCDALGFERSSGRLRTDGLFANIGRHPTTRATVCPAHLCMHCECGSLHAAIRRLLVEGDGPMIVLTPTQIDDPDIRQIVRMRHSCHLALADSINVDASRVPAITDAARSAIAAFSRVVEGWESAPTALARFRFARSGRVWVLSFNRTPCYMPHKDAGGLAYIQHLLARPNQEIPVERLEEMVTGDLALDAVSTGDAVVDREGLAKIWTEMRRLRAEMDVAERNGDKAAHSRLEGELDRLAEQVRTMHGLNDRVRRVGDQTEQLRSKVTNSIRRAIKALDELPALAAHLSAVKPGRTLSYRPDSQILWDFDAP
ncbi:MAG TPA: hypothetical protein PKE29_01560 [Phycisphaerales bacterium]|nr:hypothetical protein [Phycisphaerales bacterium]